MERYRCKWNTHNAHKIQYLAKHLKPRYKKIDSECELGILNVPKSTASSPQRATFPDATCAPFNP
jgi:hypothetical protein